jgi:hypothetical protein
MEATGPIGPVISTERIDSFEQANSTGPIEVIVPTGQSGPVATITGLLGIREALLRKEVDDKALLLSMFQPTDDDLRNALVHWATVGFPDQTTIRSVQINPPPKCADGEIRNFYHYSLYLLNIQSLTELTDALDIRVEGMNFDFTLTDINMIHLIVSKETS